MGGGRGRGRGRSERFVRSGCGGAWWLALGRFGGRRLPLDGEESRCWGREASTALLHPGPPRAQTRARPPPNETPNTNGPGGLHPWQTPQAAGLTLGDVLRLGAGRVDHLRGQCPCSTHSHPGKTLEPRGRSPLGTCCALVLAVSTTQGAALKRASKVLRLMVPSRMPCRISSICAGGPGWVCGGLQGCGQVGGWAMHVPRGSALMTAACKAPAAIVPYLGGCVEQHVPHIGIQLVGLRLRSRRRGCGV